MPISNIRKIRLRELEAIKKAGFNSYPIKTKRTHCVEEALVNFEKFSRAKTKLVLAGRITSIREHGGSTFLHFEDGTGRFQAYFKRDKLGEKNYKFFLDNFDIGDFIEVSGVLFKTKMGEKTINVSDFKILAKSLLPLPEKWHGLKDIEERFRKRYLDLIMNPEVKEKFKLRSKIIKELRNILDDRGFWGVETPILQPIPGGALARPFKTHLNALKLNLYLRVSPELYLKRLLVGGFEKVYEIGRCFRNEGMDKHHNPDFTMLELYWAYQDKEGMIKFVEEFLKDLLNEIKGTLEIFYQGQKINFKPPFKKIVFKELIKKYCQIDIEKAKIEDLQKKLKEFGIKFKKSASKTELYDHLFKKVCQPKIVQPTFVVSHPIEMAILAKASENPKYADRFQLIAGGIELINGFSELNDPVEQEKRFKKAKVEPERKDEDFLEALQYGMPPAAGLGLGVDRLVALLTDSHSLREVILFLTMKPR